MNTLERLGLGLALACTTQLALAQTTAERPITLENALGQSRQWSGIGRLKMANARQCIATLIDSGGGRAYVVTAGHCVDKRNGVIAHDLPAAGSVSFNYFADTPTERATFALRRRVWSSMQGVDLALLELDASLEEVMSQGITPLPLGDSLETGGEVRVIGEPSRPGLGLRLATCTDAAVPFVLEHPWVWRNMRSNHCPGLGPGASGSAVIDPHGRLVGVINSMAQRSDEGGRACSLNRPCQMGKQPATSGAVNYAVPLDRLKGCFAEGAANLMLDSCQLLPGFQAHFARRHSLVTKIATDEQGNHVLPTWDLAFTLDTPRYRYKTSRDPLACEDPDGYSGTIAAAENRIDDPVGTEPGWHYLCLIGVQSPEQRPSPALMANSLSLAAQLLPAVPVPPPDMSIEPMASGDVQVSWRLDPPHLATYRVKRGPPDSVDCHDPSGFRLLRHKRYTFKAAELPLKLCSMSEDLIRQRSPVRVDLLQRMP
jgi:hypothetical protein